MNSGAYNMRSGYVLSGLLHGLILIVIIFGLPDFMRPKPFEEQPIAVQMVNISDLTRALKRNPHPVAKAKLDTEPKPPAPKVPKPDLLQPTPPPPPPTASPPPPSPPVEAPTPTPAATPPLPTPAPAPTPAPPPPKAKPTPPKKTPPKPAKKPPEKRPPDKSRVDTDFDSLLQNLETTPVPQDQEKTPPRHIYRPQQEADASAQPDAPLGSELTTSELDLVRAQIEKCWSPPGGGKDEDQIVVTVQMTINQDATVATAQIVNDGGKYGTDSLWTAVADSALRAVRNPDCSPLKLPPDKYDTWKNTTINFSPQDLE